MMPVPATVAWLSTLPPCTAEQYRRKLTDGGRPMFALSREATVLAPAWWFLLLAKDGALYRVISDKSPFCRRIDSLKVAYRTAKAAGLETLNLPIDLKVMK